VNTLFGETYLERGDRPDWEPLMDRREEYKSGTVPAGVLVLTAGVDVQKDRLEYSIYGWGRKGEHWLIEHTVLTGAPVERAVWRELDNSLITRTFRSESLKADLPVRRIAVDAGYEASFVYRWARLHASDRVLVIHGKQKLPMAIGAPKTVDFNLQGKRVYRGARYYPVGTDFLKGALYGTLRLEWRKGEPFPGGFLHFPSDAPEEYFKGLTAEQLVTSETKSREVHYEWVKLPGRRNEPMDCYGYARAMAVSVGVDRWNDEAWDALEHELRDSGLANRQPAAKTRRRPYEGYLDDRRP
jgi:phage terminase large subunit GpA-like protein